MKNQPKSCFIVWAAYCRRSEVFSQFMNCDLVYIDPLIKNRGNIWHLFFWVDYLFKSICTLIYLFRHKPELVFAQSPPSFCPMVCWSYCKIFKKKLVVDAHNGSFEKPWVNIPMFIPVLRSSVVTVIVHNSELECFLKSRYKTIKFYTLHDKIPRIDLFENSMKQKRYFLFVVSYNSDEPVEEALEAFKHILETSNLKIEFKITGNYKKHPNIFNRYGSVKGIEFLGYLEDSAYLKTLQKAFGTIALSTRRMVQLCASVESLGADIPLLLSDSPTSRRLFFKGAVFTDPNASSIYNAICIFYENRRQLHSGIKEVKLQWERNWIYDYTELQRKLAS